MICSFIGQYRLNKDAFKLLLDVINVRLPPSSISGEIQLAATLRFLAEGSYQRSVGNDSSVSIGRSTVSIVLTRMLRLLQKHICPQWVQLKMAENEKRTCRNYFYSKHKIPSIIGCIDGTHIKIVKPPDDEHLFYNRKGYFSMNAMIVSIDYYNFMFC